VTKRFCAFVFLTNTVIWTICLTQTHKSITRNKYSSDHGKDELATLMVLLVSLYNDAVPFD